MLRKLLLSLALLVCLPVAANAATCFWVAGTSWNTAADWSATDVGGTGGTCAATSGIPKNAGDIAKLATAAPAATTLILDVDIASMATLDTTALTGGSGLDFSTHNITFTGQPAWSCTGTGTRTITLGTGTLTFTTNTAGNVFDCVTTTGLTWNNNTSGTFAFNNTVTGSIGIRGGNGITALPNITVAANAAGTFILTLNASSSIQSLTVVGPQYLQFPNSATTTITGNLSLTGTSYTTPVLINSNTSVAKATVNFPATGVTLNWVGFKNITGAGTQPTATNALDFGGNSNITIQAPGGGGGGFIIGGG